MNDVNPKISIIVPVYNTERYIRKCLDSLINQTFKNIEIICINDGSTDKSDEIIKEYMNLDNRIILINQENKGPSEARNKGMQIMKGEYFSFVDSDDWVDLDTYEIAYYNLKKSNSDVVMFPYIREYTRKSLKKNIFKEDEIIFNKEECGKLHRRYSGVVKSELRNIENSDALCPVCMKLYKSSIQKNNNIEFVDTKIIGTYEDGIFNLNYFEFVNKAIYINKYFYHYRKVDNATITSTYRKELLHQRLNLYDTISKYIYNRRLNEEFYIGLQNRIAIDIVPLGLNVLRSNKSNISKIKDIKAMLSSEKYRKSIEQIELKYLDIHWRIFFICCKINFSVGVFVLLIIIQRLKKLI